MTDLSTAQLYSQYHHAAIAAGVTPKSVKSFKSRQVLQQEIDRITAKIKRATEDDPEVGVPKQAEVEQNVNGHIADPTPRVAPMQRAVVEDLHPHARDDDYEDPEKRRVAKKDDEDEASGRTEDKELPVENVEPIPVKGTLIEEKAPDIEAVPTKDGVKIKVKKAENVEATFTIKLTPAMRAKLRRARAKGKFTNDWGSRWPDHLVLEMFPELKKH